MQGIALTVLIGLDRRSLLPSRLEPCSLNEFSLVQSGGNGAVDPPAVPLYDNPCLRLDKDAAVDGVGGWLQGAVWRELFDNTMVWRRDGHLPAGDPGSEPAGNSEYPLLGVYGS